MPSQNFQKSFSTQAALWTSPGWLTSLWWIARLRHEQQTNKLKVVFLPLILPLLQISRLFPRISVFCPRDFAFFQTVLALWVLKIRSLIPCSNCIKQIACFCCLDLNYFWYRFSSTFFRWPEFSPSSNWAPRDKYVPRPGIEPGSLQPSTQAKSYSNSLYICCSEPLFVWEFYPLIVSGIFPAKVKYFTISSIFPCLCSKEKSYS